MKKVKERIQNVSISKIINTRLNLKMKFLKNIVLYAVIAVFLLKFGDSKKQYHLIVYSFFAILMGVQLILNLYKYYVGKKSIILNGKIIDNANEGGYENSNQNHLYTVSFLSPNDNKEYSIKSEIENLPKDGNINVILNEKNPQASTIYFKSSILENASLLFAFIGFLYIIIFNL